MPQSQLAITEVTGHSGVSREGAELGSVPVTTLPPVLPITPVLPRHLLLTQRTLVQTRAGAETATHAHTDHDHTDLAQ